MRETKTARTELLQVRLTIKETEQIHNTFSKSTCRKLSDYVRKKLLDKPISIYTRNHSLDDFMAEMILLRGELNAIGNNYNQVVKRLHTLSDIREIKTWLLVNESSKHMLLKKVEEIKSKISQINDQWLQS
ncbi:MAG: plasmid mobilization relaxosome protein MobC [Sphingobacteriales bacterium]|nr:MAG: plasmid mobilization relaxosome protein MobC [Sphingobacteriales bacterium]